MHEVICPHCSKAFKIDEAGYAAILKQVRDGDFDNTCTSGWSWPSGKSATRLPCPRPRSPMRCKALRPAKMLRFGPCRPSPLPVRCACKLAVSELWARSAKSAMGWRTRWIKRATRGKLLRSWPRPSIPPPQATRRGLLTCAAWPMSCGRICKPQSCQWRNSPNRATTSEIAPHAATRLLTDIY